MLEIKDLHAGIEGKEILRGKYIGIGIGRQREIHSDLG